MSNVKYDVCAICLKEILHKEEILILKSTYKPCHEKCSVGHDIYYFPPVEPVFFYDFYENVWSNID